MSRQHLLAEIADLADEFSEVDGNGLHNERWCGISDSKRVIINAPSVSNKSQGEWIAYTGMLPPEFHGKHYCSNCGHVLHLALNGGIYNYCPNCGTKMKRVDDEN